MSNEVAKRPERESLEMILKRPAYQDRLKQVLGERSMQFASSLLSIGRSMPDVEPKSIVAQAMIAATLDLPIEKNLGFAWIIPYKDHGTAYAQFQMGYKGYIQLALRTGRYERMNARPVNAEAFSGFDEVGEPKIDWSKIDETQPAVGYAFAFKLVTGFTKVCYWTKAKVTAHANKYSRAFRAGADIWKSEFDKMAMKTVIANELSDWGILSVQWQVARTYDQGIVKDIGGEVEYVDNAKEDAALEDRKPQFQGPGPSVDVKTTVQAAEPPSKTPQDAPKAATAPLAPSAPEKTQEPAKAVESAPKAHVVRHMPGEEAAEPEDRFPTTQGDTAALAESGLAPSQNRTETEPEPPNPGDKAAAAAMTTANSAEPFKPNANESEALQSVRLLLHQSGKTEAQLMTWARKNKIARDDQKLADLAEGKLLKLSKQYHVIVPTII